MAYTPPTIHASYGPAWFGFERGFSNFLEDDLMQKYSEGKIVERQCPECDETFELRTAGTHVGSNNSIAVFCDDDPMVCPYCNYTEEGTTSG